MESYNRKTYIQILKDQGLFAADQYLDKCIKLNNRIAIFDKIDLITINNKNANVNDVFLLLEKAYQLGATKESVQSLRKLCNANNEYVNEVINRANNGSKLCSSISLMFYSTGLFGHQIDVSKANFYFSKTEKSYLDIKHLFFSKIKTATTKNDYINAFDDYIENLKQNNMLVKENYDDIIRTMTRPEVNPFLNLFHTPQKAIEKGNIHQIMNIENIYQSSTNVDLDFQTQATEILKVLELIDKNFITAKENFLSSIYYIIVGKCYFYNIPTEENLYKAYRAFVESEKIYKRKFMDYAYTIVEKQYLEGLLNISNNGPITDLLNKLYKLYSATDEPHSIKRHLIIGECNNRVSILLGNSINIIDKGTYSNLQNSLTSFMTEEILDIEEQQYRKNSCPKYKSRIENNTIEDAQLEKNYSDKSYLLLSGTERLIKDLLYIPFIKYLQKESQNDALTENFLRQLPSRIRGFSLNNFEEKFTIGTFTSLIGRTLDNNGQRIIPNEYVRWLKTLSTQSEDKIVNDIRNLTDDMVFIANVIRNPILHGAYAQKWTCVFALDKIMLGDNPVIRNIVELSGNSCLNELGEQWDYQI